MKAVIFLSKKFFKPHPKAGQETHFADKIRYAVWMEDQAETCKDCKEKGYDFDCGTCTGACRDFGLIPKIHTCRSNYDYWAKKIAKIKETGGVLSVRQWAGRPYRSSHELIMDIPAEHVGVQKLILCMYNDILFPHVEFEDGETKSFTLSELAFHDGLSVEDYKDWFMPAFRKAKNDVLEFAIIHFTGFRYE